MPIPTRNPVRSSRSLEVWLRPVAAVCLAWIVIACGATAWAADAARADISISGRIAPDQDAVVTLSFTNIGQADAEVVVRLPRGSTPFSSAVLILKALRAHRRFQKTFVRDDVNFDTERRAELNAELIGPSMIGIKRDPLVPGSDFTLTIDAPDVGQTFTVAQEIRELPRDRECPHLPLTVEEGECRFDLDGDAHVDPKNDLILFDFDGNGFCELFDRSLNKPAGTLRFTKCTPTELLGDVNLTVKRVEVDAGAALWADPQRRNFPLESLVLTAKDGILSFGDIALTAQERLTIRADAGNLILLGFVQLDAPRITMKANVSLLLLPQIVDPRGFTARARSSIVLSAKTPKGTIFIADAKLGARAITIDNIANTKKLVGFVRIDNALLTTDPKTVGLPANPTAGFLTIRGTLGANDPSTLMAVTIRASTVQAGSSFFVDTKDVGDHLCLIESPSEPFPPTPVFVAVDDVANFNSVEGFIYRDGEAILPPRKDVRGEDRFNSPFDSPDPTETCPVRPN